MEAKAWQASRCTRGRAAGSQPAPFLLRAHHLGNLGFSPFLTGTETSVLMQAGPLSLVCLQNAPGLLGFHMTPRPGLHTGEGGLA